MENKFLKIDDKQEWRVLLSKTLFRTFFHNPEWEEFLEKNFSWLKFEHYNWQDKALLSLARVKVFGKEKLISHPFCEYGGPLPMVDKIDIREFKQNLLSEFKYPIRISFHPQLFNYFQGDPKNEFGPSERVSYWEHGQLDLREGRHGQLDLRKTTAHEIEKARGNSLKIEECQNSEDLQSFYNLCVKSAKKHRVPVYPFSFFEYFFVLSQAVLPEAKIVLAKKNDRIIAGSVFLFYGKFVHYFQNAIDEKYKNLGANYLILFDQINKFLAENKIFDFGGTRIGSPLEVFKKGWGGKPYPIFELKNYKEELSLRGSKLRYIFGWLPPFLIKKISPGLLKYKL